MRGSARPSSVSFSRPLDRIELRGLRVDCIVGVYARERERLQPLELDLALHLDTREAARGGQLADTVDYARVAGDLRFLLEHARFHLLEAAAEALCRYLLAPPVTGARIDEVTLTLRKPEALGGDGVASLCVHRSAAELATIREPQPYGALDRIFKDPHLELTRVHLEPGAQVPSGGQELVLLVLSDGLTLAAADRPMQALRAGAALRGGAGAAADAFVIHNDSPSERALLRLERRGGASSTPAERAPYACFYYPQSTS